MEFFPSINQFKDVVKAIRDRSSYFHTPLPTLEFTGTVKLHGTNAGISNETGGVVALSRTRVLGEGNDNAGFYSQIVHPHSNIWKPYLERLGGAATVFGEWCGSGIQKGVAISSVPKKFIIFACRVDGAWVPVPEVMPDGIPEVYSIYDFPTYHISIDFTKPEQSVQQLTELTQEVEHRCPVGASFGVEGIGEGIVWTADTDLSLRFKVKGEKHSSSKVRTLVPVDAEKIESLRGLVNSVLTDNRMEQMYSELEAELGSIQNKDVGTFIQRCVKDCLKEETDTILASGFEIKEFTKMAPNVARDWFFGKL